MYEKSWSLGDHMYERKGDHMYERSGMKKARFHGPFVLFACGFSFGCDASLRSVQDDSLALDDLDVEIRPNHSYCFE